MENPVLYLKLLTHSLCCCFSFNLPYFEECTENSNMNECKRAMQIIFASLWTPALFLHNTWDAPSSTICYGHSIRSPNLQQMTSSRDTTPLSRLKVCLLLKGEGNTHKTVKTHAGHNSLKEEMKHSLKRWDVYRFVYIEVCVYAKEPDGKFLTVSRENNPHSGQFQSSVIYFCSALHNADRFKTASR